ncbi:MAG: 4Fe-4S cluster-binding domain-containing protein [bacterium]
MLLVRHKGIVHNVMNDAPFVGAIIIAPTCSRGCEGCINEHLKRQKGFITSKALDILKEIKNNPFDEGMILAGLEWTESPKQMLKLIESAINIFNMKVMIYTYMTEKEFKNKFPNLFKEKIWVKFGSYNEKLKQDSYYSCGVKLATTNQYIKLLGE